MAKNKIEDLRDHLFMAMERLNDEDIKPEDLENEIKKAKALSGLSSAIIDSAKVEIDFIKATESSTSRSQFFKEIATNSLRIEE